MDNYEYNDNTTYVRYPIVYNIDSIIDKIKKCNKEEYENVKQIILYQHDKIFTYDNLINNNFDNIKELFTDIHFLDILDNISGLLALKLTETEIVFINKIIYDFLDYSKFDYKSKNVTDIRSKMYSIIRSINFVDITRLSPIIGINDAVTLSMISKSSFKYETIVHRVNMFIYDSSFDYGIISKIYRIIHGNYQFGCDLVEAVGVRKFTSLFTYTMLEYANNEADDHFMGQFNSISKLILDMLNDLNSNDLENVLLNYANIINLYNTPINKLRFSIKEHIKYGKLSTFIKIIENKHNIYIY